MNAYNEQNGPTYTDHENFALPGSDADRDYWYGEDEIDEVFGDSTDYNTADEQRWIQIGKPGGYAISDKENVTIDDSFLDKYEGCQVRQIRWVVKAVPTTDEKGRAITPRVDDDRLSHEVAVPHGFRLDVDAVPDSDEKLYDQNGKEVVTAGKQEADEFDPLRLNAGWGYKKNNHGQVQILDAAGNYYPDTTVALHSGITDNAPMVDFATSLLNTPTVGQASQNPPDNEAPSAEADPSVHVNHFVSAVPRYDDTKSVETERSRAGFIRTPESPVLALEIIHR